MRRFYFTIGLYWFLGFVVSGQPDSVLQRVRLHLLEQDTEKALEVCEEARARGLDASGGISYQESLIHRSMMRFSRARQSIERALATDSTDLDYIEEWGRVAQASGNRLGARKAYERVFEADSSRLFAGNQLARYHISDQRYSTALEVFRILVRQNSDNGYYERMIGFCLIRMKQPRKALPHMRTAVALDSTDIRAYEFLTILYDGVGEQDSAIYLLEKALRFYPDHPQVYHWMGNVYMSDNHYYAAIPCLEKSEALGHKDFTLVSDMARAYHRTLDYPKAKKYYLMYLEAYEDYHTYLALGAVYERMGDLDSALYCYETVLSTSLPAANENGYKLSLAAKMNARLGNMERAEQIYRALPGYSMAPELRDYYLMESHERTGYLYQEYTEDYEKALSFYEKALEYYGKLEDAYPNTRKRILKNMEIVKEELFFRGKMNE